MDNHKHEDMAQKSHGHGVHSHKEVGFIFFFLSIWLLGLTAFVVSHVLGKGG